MDNENSYIKLSAEYVRIKIHFYQEIYFDSDIKIESIFLYLIFKCINGKINY